jgi:adenosylcobinamide-GDP ribazoletransferase
MTAGLPAGSGAAPRPHLARRIGAGAAGAMAALGLLTTIPLPRGVHRAPSAATLAGFAGAGLLLGGAMAGLEAALAPLLPVAPRSAVLLATLAVLSGGIHLDGLADCADGLLGGRTPEERLAIMRDSRVGGFGVAAVVAVVLCEYAGLGAIGGLRLQALVVAVTASRTATALGLGISTPARADGLGHAYAVPHRAAGAAIAVVVAAAAGWELLGVRGLVTTGAALLVAPAIAALARRRVGGMTGDGFGAIAELGLAVALLCLCARR